MKTILQSARIFAVLSLITGGLYPVAVWGLGQLFFRDLAEGSLIEAEGKIIGSALIAQKFNQLHYFWIRPSAADYATMPSGASNTSWTSKPLRDRIDATVSGLLGAHGLNAGTVVPVELVTTSGSGLDPHLGIDAILFQVDRIVNARHLDAKEEEQLQALIEQSREAGMFSASYINVLRLNLALDAFFGKVG